MSNVIETKDLCFHYGKQQVLNNVNLQVPEGSIFGFLGANGAGKSTTIRLLLGLMTPSSGSVHVLGKDIATSRLEILSKVGSLIDFPSAYDHLTASDNLRVIATLMGIDKKRIDEVLSLVGLSDETEKKVKSYSVGMKQRLGLAIALIANAPVLVLDEPSNGLDPAGIAELRNLLIRLNTTQGKTILISSHILSEIEKVSTHVAILHKGVLRFQDTKQKLLHMSPSIEDSFFKLTSDEPGA